MLRPLALLMIVLPLLAACSNAPEQPSDTPDTQPDLLSGDDAGTDSIPEIPEPVTTTPTDPSSVFGSWAADTAACGDAANAPIRVSATRFESPTEACDISDLVDNGAGFTASLTCQREGGADAVLLKLTPEDDTLTLAWVGRDEPDLVLGRCE